MDRYDPDLGRFITEDPIKDGLNWYAYVANNPLRYIDPTGLRSRDDVYEDYGYTDNGYGSPEEDRGGLAEDEIQTDEDLLAELENWKYIDKYPYYNNEESFNNPLLDDKYNEKVIRKTDLLSAIPLVLKNSTYDSYNGISIISIGDGIGNPESALVTTKLSVYRKAGSAEIEFYKIEQGKLATREERIKTGKNTDIEDIGADAAHEFLESNTGMIQRALDTEPNVVERFIEKVQEVIYKVMTSGVNYKY